MRNLRLKISLLLSLCIFAVTTVPANVQAVSTANYKMKVSSEKKIADAFNKFRYDMTVEWDQKDPYFKQHAQTELENSLIALRAEGVSVEEIQAFMEKNILDAKTKNEYQRLLSAVKKQNLSEDEAAEVAMKFMEKNYRQGVNFSSGSSINYKKVLVIVGVVIVGVVTYLIIKKCKKNDNSSTVTSSTSSSSSSSSSTTSSSDSSTTGGDDSSSSSDSSTTGGDDSSSSSDSSTTGGDNGSNGGTNANNGFGNGDQDAPGGSCTHNNAENSDCQV